MSVEVKGSIKFDPDVKAGDAEYVVECKQLGVCEGGCGELEVMIDQLTKKVQVAVSEEFHIPPANVQVAKYSMNLTFEIVAPQNKTLDLFMDVVQRKDGQKIVESAEAIMTIAKATGKDPLQVFEAVKKKAGIGGKSTQICEEVVKKVNSGALDDIAGCKVTATFQKGVPPEAEE